MNRSAGYFLLIMFSFASGCGGGSSVSVSPTPSQTPRAAVSPSPALEPSPQFPKNGDYPGTGTVTKINLEIGSVEMDHDEIKGVMPPMRMEFYVSDKKLLDGLALGDKVSFTLRYKDHTETIVDIKKTR
jgi:Cu/Ag efflux protein CusF